MTECPNCESTNLEKDGDDPRCLRCMDCGWLIDPDEYE